MIEYDYELVRTTGKNVEIYKPNEIPKTLPNCVDITGRNSIGKSTLLHIIASGFGGVDNEKIHPALRKKMENIMNSAYQKIRFQIKIKNHNGVLELTSEKLDPEKSEIIIHEKVNGNSQILSPLEFRSKYNLIYDIPESPTDRLKEFTREIQDTQRTYASRLQVFNEFIRRNISEINNRDPKRLIELENQLNKLREDNIILSKIIELSENNLNMLIYATCKKYIEEYRIKMDNTEILLDKAIKYEKSIMKEENKYIKIQQEIKNKIDNLEETFKKTTYLMRDLIPSNEKYNLDIWERIDIKGMGKNFRIDSDFRSLIVKFSSIIKDIYYANKLNFQKIELYQDLKDVLIPYTSSKIILPGIDLSIDGYIDILDHAIITNKNLTKDNENMKNCTNLLELLLRSSKELEENYFPKIKEMIKNKTQKDNNIQIENDIESLKESSEQLQERLDSYKMRFDFYRSQISKIKVNENCAIGAGKLSKYINSSEEDLSKEMTTLREDILSKKATLNHNEGIISHLEADIQNLKRQKLNKYESHKEILDRLLLIGESLERKFRIDFQTYLEKIPRYKKEDIVNLNSKQRDYYNALFSYLGKRVDTIRHIDKEYKVENIDLIGNYFTSNEGEIINFLDMGTGQGQLAYLLGLLNTRDDRKIIALLDEVAMMDNTTLGFIHEKIRELYNKNRLIVGIIVQAQREIDQVKISEI